MLSFYSSRDGTKGLMHACQVLHQPGHIPSPEVVAFSLDDARHSLRRILENFIIRGNIVSWRAKAVLWGWLD